MTWPRPWTRSSSPDPQDSPAMAAVRNSYQATRQPIRRSVRSPSKPLPDPTITAGRQLAEDLDLSGPVCEGRCPDAVYMVTLGGPDTPRRRAGRAPAAAQGSRRCAGPVPAPDGTHRTRPQCGGDGLLRDSAGGWGPMRPRADHGTSGRCSSPARESGVASAGTSPASPT